MPIHQWLHSGSIVADNKYDMVLRGQRIQTAIRHGQVIWNSSDKDTEGYDVCVWDPDGTLVAHYSALTFLLSTQQTETFPALHRKWTPTTLNNPLLKTLSQNTPIHWDQDEVLLRPDGYNWDFEEAWFFVAKYGYIDLGLEYTSEFSPIWLYVPEDGAELHLGIWARSGTATIDFGDGTVSDLSALNDKGEIPGEQIVNANLSRIYHTYAERGLYMLKAYGDISIGGLWVQSGVSYFGNAQKLVEYGIERAVEVVDPDVNHAAEAASARVLGVYLTQGVVSNGAFKNAVNCSMVGLGQGTSIGPVDTFFNTQSLRHLTIPIGVTRLQHNTYNTETRTYERWYEYTNLANIKVRLWMHPFADEICYLETICLPSGWIGSYYPGTENAVPAFTIDKACHLKRIIFPETSDNIGQISGLTSSFKLLLISNSVKTLSPSIVDISFINKAEDFTCYVPYVINAGWFTGDHNYDARWVYGVQTYSNVFSSINGAKQMLPLTAAPHYTTYWG